MATSSRPSSYHYVVDEALLRTIAAQIQAAIPGAQVRLFGSRACGTERPDSDLDLLVTVPDAWLACHSRLEETDALGWKLAITACRSNCCFSPPVRWRSGAMEVRT